MISFVLAIDMDEVKNETINMQTTSDNGNNNHNT